MGTGIVSPLFFFFLKYRKSALIINLFEKQRDKEREKVPCTYYQNLKSIQKIIDLSGDGGPTPNISH